jgi:AcrR family transcriptional regulator
MSSVSHGSPRSPKTKKQQIVRNHIWAAALDLFYNAGFENTNVDQIAAAAGVSRRTFFRYFASKEDILAATIRNFGEALATAISRQPPSQSQLLTAKLAVEEVLSPHFPGENAERTIQILRRSAAARSAQHLSSAEVEEKLARAFSTRRRKRSISLQDRMLASITLSATRICSEVWIDHPKRSIARLVDEAFTALEELARLSSQPEKQSKKRASAN